MKSSNKIINLAIQIRKDTKSNFKIDFVEKYITGFNSWLHNPLVPARPILDTAMFESSSIAIASFFLAIHGFYEEACSLLRGILDGFLTRLYWDGKNRSGKLKKWEQSNGRSTNEYWEWESGKTKEYPDYSKIKKFLGAEDLIKKYNKNYCLWDDIGKLKSKLNKFVHTRPESRHHDRAVRSSMNITEFKKKHFDEWYNYVRSIYCIISILYILQYPELFYLKCIKEFKELEPKTFERIKSVLNK